MTLKLATEFDFSSEMLMHIRHGVLLHDIGKLGVPDNILFKPDKLTDEEWVVVRGIPPSPSKCSLPFNILTERSIFHTAITKNGMVRAIRRGLSGEQIPLEARIFAVVDVWDALISDRPYRKAWTRKKALKHIQSLAGTHFDARVVERFVKEVADENK